MTTAINLAGPADDDRLMSLYYHEECRLPYDDAHRAAVVAPLLEGSPLVDWSRTRIVRLCDGQFRLVSAAWRDDRLGRRGVYSPSRGIGTGVLP